MFVFLKSTDTYKVVILIYNYFILFHFIFEIKFHMPRTEDELELKILLASIINCWDYRIMPPCLVDRYIVYVYCILMVNVHYMHIVYN